MKGMRPKVSESAAVTGARKRLRRLQTVQPVVDRPWYRTMSPFTSPMSLDWFDAPLSPHCISLCTDGRASLSDVVAGSVGERALEGGWVLQGTDQRICTVKCW